MADALPLTEGVEHLFKTLNSLGYKTAILSGGFDFFGKVLQEKLGIDYVYANKLEIEGDKLTGKVIEPIVDASKKARPGASACGAGRYLAGTGDCSRRWGK